MFSDLSYIFKSNEQKREALVALALEDSFFKPIVHDLIDYGYEVSFSPFGGAGAYQPHALETEFLDTTEKQDMFVAGFRKQAEAGAFKAKIRLSLWLGLGGNVHSFLHEVMHFYQDTLGLYLLPLKEQGVMPVMADLRSYVMAALFCEAWAETEALRTCRALGGAAWKGAMASPDWGELAKFYDARMAENRSEAYAAARTFEQWYKGAHRGFYERHALEIYDSEFVRFTGDVEGASKTDGAIGEHLRSARISGLLKKIPQAAVPEYFNDIDLENAAFNEPCDEALLRRCAAQVERYGSARGDALHEIKCASPPYLWKRLREAEIMDSEVPPAPEEA